MKKLLEAASVIWNAPRDSDILLYHADIERDGYEKVSDLCELPTGHKNVLLILETNGGDPHAAFRIGRCLGSRYEKFTALVPGWCKSAGTLLCAGAHEIVISDRGELGPLDIQIWKPDELGESGSGLDLLKTLTYLQSNAYDAFREFLIDIRAGSQMATKIAAEMATGLAVGLYGRIFDQVDPVRVGEVQRLIRITSCYGDRLAEKSKNLKPGAIAKLVTEYPTHSFVIDRKEAKELFINVRAPTPEEDLLGRTLPKSQNICYFTPPPNSGTTTKNHEDTTTQDEHTVDPTNDVGDRNADA